jgi:hypothetical protein
VDGCFAAMKVLYVLGSSRCGSTVLGNALGEITGVFAAGEVRFLWERALRGRLCGCRSPVGSCEVWGKVLSRVADEGGAVPEEMIAYDRAVLRPHHLASLLMRRSGETAGAPPLARYAATLRATYHALAEFTDAQVIVDTSKRPTNGAVTRLLPDVDSYFLHLVRDPRAVAHSQSRSKPNPDGAPTGQMATLSPASSCAFWCATNVMADALRWRVGSHRSLLLRYDDLVERPEQAVDRILRLIHEPTSPGIFIDEHTVRIGSHHTVAGNADRFLSGDITFRSDDRWLRDMADRDRRLVGFLAAPLIVRYGLPLSTRTPEEHAGMGR